MLPYLETPNFQIIFFILPDRPLNNNVLAYIYSINYNRMTLDLSPSDAQLVIFERINNYVEFNEIPLSKFWTSNRLCLTREEFLKLLPNISFTITEEELEALDAERIEFINLAAVIEGVEYWKSHQLNVGNFITKQEELAALEMQNMKQKDREQNKNKYELRVQTATSRVSATSKSRTISRQLQAEVNLSETLIKAKNESDYELMMKVGEINDICKKLKNSLTFIIDASNGETKIVEIDGKTGREEVIKPKTFEKKYIQHKSASLQKGQEIEGTLEEDLKKTLVEVMHLSDQLQEQICLLQAKGVTH